MSDMPDEDAAENSAAMTGTSSAFLRLLAHELRNYIAPMHNAMHLLRLKSRADPTLAPVIDIVERQLTAMSGTLDALGEMDRVHRGEIVLDRAPAAFATIVDRAVQSLPSSTSGQRDRIDVDVEAQLPLLDVDAARMTRVLAALIDNALRYTPGESPVRVVARNTSNGVEIAVEDRGSGLSASARQSVVEFFATAHQPGHGLGLGLPLAASMVRLHGGSLVVEQASGGGTRVVIRLPRSAQSKTSDDTQTSSASAGVTVAAPATESASPAPGRRVLLADDSAAVRASLTDLLEEMGHEVRAVADGAEAVSVAQAWRPEFVLLDIHMPKLNGFDAARQLRALYPSSTMQLVMMSGDGLDDVVRHGARLAGFDHCVDKGLAIGELTAILARPATTGQPQQNSL